MINISTNPDKELVNQIREAMKENNGFCPCKIEKIPENKCICKEFWKQEQKGFCHCGLYYKEVKND